MNRKITKLMLAGALLIGTAFLPRSGQAVTCCFTCEETWDACVTACASSTNKPACNAACNTHFNTCQSGCGHNVTCER